MKPWKWLTNEERLIRVKEYQMAMESGLMLDEMYLYGLRPPATEFEESLQALLHQIRHRKTSNE